MQDFDPETRALIEQHVGPINRDMAIGGAYEGASQFDRGVATWRPPLQSADGDLLPVKEISDARVRDTNRNDGYVQSGGQIHKDSIVGAFFMLNAKPNLRALGIKDEKWEQEFQEEVEAKWTIGAESPNHWIDVTRTMTFTEQIRLAVGVYAASGEALASSEWLRSSTRPFKTAIQMIDVDRLRTPYNRTPSDNVRGGVQLDRFGAPVGYWIKDNPQTNGNMLYDGYSDAKYVPAFKPWGRRNIIYCREMKRPHQTRGIADLVAGLLETKIARQFRKVTLQNAVTGAMFAASIESELPAEAVYAQLGAGNVKIGQAITDYGQSYLSAITQYASGAKGLQIDGVKIPHLFPGSKLQLRPVGAPGGVGQEFEQSLIRYLAALLGVSYEQLSKDYSQTNYSSMKGGLNESWKFMQGRKKFVADFFANCIYMLWFEEMIGNNQLECMKRASLPNFYEPLMAEAYCAADWIGSGRGQIDELKETQAAILRIKSGLSTFEDELGRMGKDWRTNFKQLARELATMDPDLKDIIFQTQDPGLAAASDAANNAEAGEQRGSGITKKAKK